MWAQRDLATLAIHHGDNATAEAAIGRLTVDYADRKDTPAALNFLADCYMNVKKYENGGVIYQRLVEKYPTNDLMPLVKAGLGLVQVRRGDDKAGEAIYQTVLTDYAGHPRLAQAVNLMAEGYYQQALAVQADLVRSDRRAYRQQMREGGPPQGVSSYYEKALAKWEIIINQLPEVSDITPIAYLYTGIVYSQLKDYGRAEPFFNKVVSSYPNHEGADYALVTMGLSYGKMARRGEITKEEANRLAGPIFQALLDRYPASEYVKIASSELRRRGQTTGTEKENSNVSGTIAPDSDNTRRR